MAGIDKIYGTQKQYDQFITWCKKHHRRKKLHKYFYPVEGYEASKYERPITNFPKRHDMWLLKNCPFDWVTNRIKEQYGLD